MANKSLQSLVEEEKCYHLRLGENCALFEPISSLIKVFYDESNQQLFAVRSNGATGVVVKSANAELYHSFRFEDKGTVVSIKFSPNKDILAVQRSQTAVEFANLTDQILDPIEYSHSCKVRNAKLLGCEWTQAKEIVFVSDQGLELYQVIPEKRSLKHLKTYSHTIVWYSYLAEKQVLILASGNLANQILTYLVRHGSLYKLSKFEVDLPVGSNKQTKSSLLGRDVTLSSVYDEIRIIVLKHQPKQNGAEIVIYTVQRDGPAKKTDVLKLGTNGRFAVNTVDNIIVVHHQETKTSMLFDIKLDTEFDGYVHYHKPLTTALPIQPFILRTGSGDIDCDLYSANWVVFQPDIIIDAKLGCLWKMELNLPSVANDVEEKIKLINCLSLREGSKAVILDVCRSAILEKKSNSLAIISKIFDKLNSNYKETNSGASKRLPKLAIIDQNDIYDKVLSQLSDLDEISSEYLVTILIEYIKSLGEHDIVVSHFIHEIFIKTLVRAGQLFQLHQILQYHILADSRSLAILLLSIDYIYPPSYQLALDMLKRLGTADEEIIDILLAKQQLVPCIQFLQSCTNKVDNASPRKYLSAAYLTKNPTVFYTVMKFFEQRNLRLRKCPNFAKDEQCDEFVDYFEKLFLRNEFDID